MLVMQEQGTNATSSHLRALSLNDLWAYEFKSRVWFELSVQEGQPIPSPRFGHGAAAFDDGQRMIIFGGNVLPRGTPGSCDDLQHTSAETWVFRFVPPPHLSLTRLATAQQPPLVAEIGPR